MALPGIDLIGPLPAEIQRYTVFSAAVLAGVREADAAKALISFLSSAAAAAAFKKWVGSRRHDDRSGLESDVEAMPSNFRLESKAVMHDPGHVFQSWLNSRYDLRYDNQHHELATDT